MITLKKHEIRASVKDRYANIEYLFDFENKNNFGSNELKFEITIDPNAFISKFEANIDGELFIGKTKEKEIASKQYVAAKEKNENAILISQPHKQIQNLFQIKTNIDSKSKISLNIQIEQYLQKTFGFNQLNIQIFRNFDKYNIKPIFDDILFKLNIEDNSGIFDVDVPTNNNNDIIIHEKIVNKIKTKCEINGKISNKSNDINTDMTINQMIRNEWRNSLKINDKIDVKDGRKWYIAQIIEINTAQKQIKIHYLGYTTKYDEYIDIRSDRLAPFNANTEKIKCNELILKYKVSGESNESHILFNNKSNTFCHIICDIITDSISIHHEKDIVDEEQNDKIENLQNDTLIPRRVMFVIDRSGSMAGSKWIKTISSTIMAIKQLKKGLDRFGIILFDDKIQLLPYSDTRGCILADNKSITDSINTLQNVNVGGATNINDALLKAIEMIKIDILLLNNDNNIKYNFYMNQIIFITDGEPNNGECSTTKIVTNIKNANDLSKIDKYNNKMSIFSFGVGNDGNDSEWINDLNHSFLKILSLNNNGFYKRIKQTSADTVLSQYFTILSQPVLSNINIKYKNKNITNLTETQFNTLYEGNDIIVCGKIDDIDINNDYNLSLKISAITGKQIKQINDEKLISKPINIEKNIKININDNMDNNNNNNNNTERIWAYLKLQQFTKQELIYKDMIEIDDDEKKEEEALPLSLAMKYKFVTPWTSMIVVKHKDKTELNKKTKQQQQDYDDDDDEEEEEDEDEDDDDDDDDYDDECAEEKEDDDDYDDDGGLDDDDEILTLKSGGSNPISFEISKKCAESSKFCTTILEGDADATSIEIRQVPPETLQIVINYLKKQNNVTFDGVEWIDTFDFKTISDITTAANYMDIKSLYILGNKAIDKRKQLSNINNLQNCSISNMVYIIKIILININLSDLNQCKEIICKYFVEKQIDGKVFISLTQKNEFIKNLINYIQQNNKQQITNKSVKILQTNILTFDFKAIC